MFIHGECHCGNVAFDLRWKPDPGEIAARACTCSFCTKHGAVWTSRSDGSLTVAVRDAAQVSRYTFGTATAEFHICICCGAVPVVTSEIEGRMYAVVNVNTFEAVDPSLVKRSPANLDDEEKVERLARRKRGWIADVKFIKAAP